MANAAQIAKRLAKLAGTTKRIELNLKGETLEVIECEGMTRDELFAQDLLDIAQEQADLAGASIQLTVQGFNEDERLCGSFLLRVAPSEKAKAAFSASKPTVLTPHHSELSEVTSSLLKSNERLVGQIQGLIQQFGVGVSSMAAAQAATMQALSARLMSAESERDQVKAQLDQAISLGTELSSELQATRSLTKKVETVAGMLMKTPMLRALDSSADAALPPANGAANGAANGVAKQ